MAEECTHRPDWPIAVYAAVDGSIPGEPFVAYPMVPDGKRGFRIISRFKGQSVSEARAAAQAWIDETFAKHRRKAENYKAGAEKRRAARAEAE